ncbi:hypothetical protein B0H13DRAFT_2460845, partial [Mycena leptocephala]
DSTAHTSSNSTPLAHSPSKSQSAPHGTIARTRRTQSRSRRPRSTRTDTECRPPPLPRPSRGHPPAAAHPPRAVSYYHPRRRPRPAHSHSNAHPHSRLRPPRVTRSSAAAVVAADGAAPGGCSLTRVRVRGGASRAAFSSIYHRSAVCVRGWGTIFAQRECWCFDGGPNETYRQSLKSVGIRVCMNSGCRGQMSTRRRGRHILGE